MNLGTSVKLLTALAIVLSACGCPNEGPDVHSRFVPERDAACAAVDGCEAEFLASIPVYVVHDVRNSGMCGSENAVACFCEGVGCQSIVVNHEGVLMKGCTEATEGCVFTQELMMLHEYVHAAFASTGDALSDHGPEFDAALKRAFGIWKNR